MSLLSWVAFVAAAAVGAPARYVIDTAVSLRAKGAFPWGTFVVNITGSFILGLVAGLGLYHGLSGTARVVVGTGFLGAYTTFSTFTFETVRLLEDGVRSEALINIAASVLAGAAAAAAGLALAAL